MFSENVTMEKVTLNQKEQNRLKVLNEVNLKQMTIGQAATLMQVSLRHAKRLLAGYRKEGASALAHGNRGKLPYNVLDMTIRQQVVDLAKTKYRGFNQQHFSEKLREREGVPLSRSTVRRILLTEGIASPRRRKAPKHRSRRDRYAQAGMLLQTDGSPHDWLEGRGPKMCLIGAIDDATSEVVYAHFQSVETTAGYIRMLRAITSSHGIPLALYHDRHSIFKVTDHQITLDEQLAGKSPQTQLGRILEELGINSISANSPQAKGRVERLWGTFQDRLVSELRQVGASNESEANQTLKEFLADYNQRFMVQAKEAGSAYRQPQPDFKADQVFCYKYTRLVGIDNVVQFEQKRIQILPSAYRQSYAHCRVEIQVGLDNTLAICYQGQILKSRPAPLEAPALRKQNLIPIAQNKKNPLNATPAFHPWRQWVHR
ncbi:MAG: ISNCY family transposase [Syntrophomonadaceae bacterium]|nr:ISNCY family transposase [Syntrophomonadaceae bacterium]